MNTHAAAATSGYRADVSRTAIAQGTALGICLALVADTVVYMLGNLGSPIRVVTGWSPDGADLRISEVIVTVVVSILAGALVLWVLERRRGHGFRIWAVLAATVAVVSTIPLLGLDVDAGSKLALSSMHILTGTSAVVAHAIYRRSH